MTLLLILLGFVLFLLIVTVYWRHVIDQGLMGYFRAGELLTEGYIPLAWVRAIDRRLWWQGLLPLGLLRQPPTGTELAIAKLDEVATFLLNHTAALEPEAKKLLFAQLKRTREQWQRTPWTELRLLTQSTTIEQPTNRPTTKIE